MIEIGLDQYLTASIFVPAQVFALPTPKEVAETDAIEARINANPFGITARVTPARPASARPMPNPRYDSVLQEVGVDPDVYRERGSVTVRIEVGYWRKANQIHGWFEGRHTIENEVDVFVDREELAELRDDCKQVLADHDLAEELLPTQSGFFFGDTTYDEWYFKDLEDTITLLDRVLTDPALAEADFYYRGWW